MEKKSLLPWRLIKRNGLINTIFKVPWRRFLMQRNIDKINMEIPDTVSVVIGVKNRNDHKLRNTLWSIRNQDYPENLVEILIVDYESNITAKKAAEKLALEFKALFIPLTNTVGWNKSKCYNYGIKKASGKFIVSCDADIIFEKNYFDEMIKKLKKNPLSVIYSQMMDLPESSNDFVVTYCNDNTEIPYDFLYKLTTPRSSGDIHPGTNATYKIYLSFN
jgi:glycosyltransferase involved in cell wall biosynthesis